MKKDHHFYCHTFSHKGKVEPVRLCQGWTSWETLITTAWNCASQIFSKTNWLGVLFGLGATGQTQALREQKVPALGLKRTSDIPGRILSLHVQLTVLWLEKIRRVEGRTGPCWLSGHPTYWSMGCGERTKVFQRCFWCRNDHDVPVGSLEESWMGREITGVLSLFLVVWYFFPIYIFNH